MRPAGLLHSEISGSKCVCHSPELIAAYHVLRRLAMPRHPPCALSRLIVLSNFQSENTISVLMLYNLLLPAARRLRGVRLLLFFRLFGCQRSENRVIVRKRNRFGKSLVASG